MDQQLVLPTWQADVGVLEPLALSSAFSGIMRFGVTSLSLLPYVSAMLVRLFLKEKKSLSSSLRL